MKTLDDIRKIPEKDLKEDDHPKAKDITFNEAVAAMNELSKRIKGKKNLRVDTDEERVKRRRRILAALNSTENPY